MPKVVLAVTLTLVSGLIVGCDKATEPSSPEGQSVNWKVKVISATRGPHKDSYGLMTSPQLSVDLVVEYVGSEKDAPFERPSVALDGKNLEFVGYSGNITERTMGRKFSESFSYEDPGPEPAGTPRQFSLKYADVPPINFSLMEKKATNTNE